MKKLLIAVILMGILLSVSSCSREHEHEWKDATCVTPKTCTECGLTEGTVVVNHNYVSDQCTNCGIVRLTLDNYEDYLEYDAYFKPGIISGDYYSSIKCFIDWVGDSHYKFKNASVNVRFYHLKKNDETGYYEEYRQENITVKLNLSGKGSGSCELFVWPFDEEHGDIDIADFNNVAMRTQMEIIDVFGTVEEY